MRMITSLAVVVCIAFLASPVWAGSGAYRLEVPDAGAMGKGGSFVGEANTPSAVYYNPAGMTQIKKASLSLGASLIQPKISYAPESGNKGQMKDGSFVVPNFFYVTNLGIERVALGIGASSSWGLVTEWMPNAAVRYSATRSEVANQDYMLTAGYKVSDSLSLGLGVDIDSSKVNKQKKVIQVGGNDGNFKLTGDNIAAGVRLAALYKVSDQHQFGLMYRSTIQHKYKGKVHLDDLNTVGQASLGGFSYQAVFGGASYETDVISKSTLPQSVVLGYSFKPSAKWVWNADVEWMDWSSVEKEELAYPSESDATRLSVLNDGNPIPRDWKSSISASWGAQYNMSDRLRLRGGYFYHQTPIPKQNLDAALPDSDSQSVTTGFGYDLSKDLTLDFAWAAMFFKDRAISNNVADATGGIDGTYRQWVNLVLATLTYSF